MNPNSLTLQDVEHLKVLRICHFIWGGLSLMGALGGLIYIVLGGLFASRALPSDGPDANPEVMGAIFLVIGVFLIIFCLLYAGLNVYSGISLGKQQNRTLSLITAGLNSLSIPLGTVLGIFTIMVLMRPTVKAAYEQNAVARPLA